MSLCLKASKAALAQMMHSVNMAVVIIIVVIVYLHNLHHCLLLHSQKCCLFLTGKRKLFVLSQKKLRPGEFKELPAHDQPAPVCQICTKSWLACVHQACVPACVRMCACSVASVVSDSFQPREPSRPGSSSMGFSRRKY